MGSTFVIGHTQVSPGELQEKHATGELDRFHAAGGSGRMEMAAGTVRAADISTTAPDFTEIGIGKPLSLEILTVYTGDAPPRRGFGRKPDLLITSGVKSVETFNAAPKAINQLVPKVDDNNYLQPSAFREGSMIAYYTPSVTNDTTLCSFQMVADSFDEKIFNQLSSLFGHAGGLPIFAPQSTYLLAGSFLLKIAGKIGKALFESGPFLSADLNLPFETPGLPLAKAHNAVVYNDRDTNDLQGYHVQLVGDRLALVDPQSGDRYQGKAPYLIVSLDGRERTNLASFSPTLASAAILDQFYGSDDPTGAVIGALSSAVTLYNDSVSRKKAQDQQARLKQLTQQIQNLDPKSPTYTADLARLQQQFSRSSRLYSAWSAKIQDALFKMPAPPAMPPTTTAAPT